MTISGAFSRKQKALLALRMLLPIPKPRLPYRGQLTGFRKALTNKVFHPRAVAEYKEAGPRYFARHVIEYPGGVRKYHYDLGNFRAKGIGPKAAYIAEEASRFGTAGAIGTAGTLGVRRAVIASREKKRARGLPPN